MSLNKKKELAEIAKELSRELRKNQTYAEVIVWGLLRNRKFHDLKFYRQHPVFFDILGKESIYITDFFVLKETW